ncbi:hypothetical protein EOT10_19070 [Streptomyces antnestii]|uniref:Uncharacterized protein n=1 Tax=Streptomyces antnestii TaxID=2494256 RepID=A0A437PLH6_9ACTN|nr:hypothetical protein [Streptomyces sp. San01]RVU23148.1 hypothetical protein EOT10_19070 [Streptomyces sp. San01]
MKGLRCLEGAPGEGVERGYIGEEGRRRGDEEGGVGGEGRQSADRCFLAVQELPEQGLSTK